MSSRLPRYRSPKEGAAASGGDGLLRRLEDRLEVQLHVFAIDFDAKSASLLAAICEYVEHLRDAGSTAEQAIIAFKRILDRVMPYENVTDPLRVHDRTRPLVTVCINAFYSVR
jgi:hypothetical protein